MLLCLASLSHCCVYIKKFVGFMYNMTDYHYITVVDHHQTNLKLKKRNSIIYYFNFDNSGYSPIRRIYIPEELKSVNEQCALDQF